MSFNGSGTFNLASGNPVVTGTTISSTWANATLSDIATGLSNCITRDGQSPATANLPMGGYKLTGLAAGSANGDSVRYEQVTSAVAITGGTINGATIGASTASTGAFTTLSASSTVTLSGGTANGVLYLDGSKVATSGSALVFDGTNLGIGTSSPSFKLDLQGGRSVLSANSEQYALGLRYNVATNGVWLGSPSSNAFAVYGFGGGEYMRIDSSGNLGLGVTPTSGYGILQYSSTNGSYMTRGDATASLAAFNSEHYLISNATLNNAGSWSARATTASTVSSRSGYIVFTTDSGLTNGSAFSPTERMRIDSSGNVGIGTSSPTNALEVSRTSANSAIRISTVTSGNPNLYFSLDGNLNGYITYSRLASSLRFSSEGSNFEYEILSTGVQTWYSTSAVPNITLDNAGNYYLRSGNLWQYAPAPTSISTTTTLTAAQLITSIINTTGTTYTVTLPTGTAIDAGFTGVPTTNIGFDFDVINTASGTITMAVNTGVTSLGTLTIATGVSARFRLRRTAANTYVLYRLG